jgi:serine kinase of HPr protein (carbohydrate metabolism regulator)
MGAVQIAGCSAAGKSAVAAELARRGLASIDADDDPWLARFVDPAGAVVAEAPAAPDPLQDRLRSSGAIAVDARQPLGQVVDAILARTRPENNSFKSAG